jgi:hypothetical protein
MKILTVAVLSAGLAFPAVLEKAPRQPAQCPGVQETGKRKGAPRKNVLKRAGKGLLSAAMFLAEPEK